MESGPENTYASEKPPKIIASCVASRWEEMKIVGGSPVVSLRETEAGYRVSLYLSGNLHYLAETERTNLGSRTKLYIGRVVSFGTNPQVQDVAKCH